MNCRMFCSIPGLYPLVMPIAPLPTPHPQLGHQKCLQGLVNVSGQESGRRKLHLVENACVKTIKCAYVPFLLSLPHPHFRSHLSRSSQNTRLGSLCYTATSHHIHLHTVVCVLMLPSPFVPFTPSRTVSTSLFPSSASQEG